MIFICTCLLPFKNMKFLLSIFLELKLEAETEFIDSYIKYLSQKRTF